jgi:hypothetical protein
MDELKWFFIALAVCALAGSAAVSAKHFADAMISIEAAKAGLVQQIVKVPGYSPETIWVKPPAQPLIEKEKP